MNSTEKQVAKLGFQIRNGLILLMELAKEDQGALEELATSLVNFLHSFNQAALRNPSHFAELASLCSDWPGLISVDKDRVAHNKAIAQIIQLGEKHQLNFKGKKQWSRRTPEIRAALWIVDTLSRNNDKYKLPPLTKSTAGQWWKAGKKFLRVWYGAKYDGAFEDHPLFKHHWKNAKLSCGDAGLTAQTWVRKQILTKVEQALKTIAPAG